MNSGGYFRHKISSRIEERRARRRRTDSDSRDDGESNSRSTSADASYSSSFSGGATRYSGLLRQTSEHDFLMVEDEERPGRSRSSGNGFSQQGRSNDCTSTPLDEADGGGDSQDDDIAQGHLALEQKAEPRHESEEPISERDLETLGVFDEEEDEHLTKPSFKEKKKVKKEEAEKVWKVADTTIYEQQLECLQDQLTSALIENQGLKSK